MRGTISRKHPWEVMPDLYFYRDPEEFEKEEQAAAEKAVTKKEFQGEWTAPAPEFTAAKPEAADWSDVCRCPRYPSNSSLLKTGVPSQPLRIGQQLPHHRPPSGLKPPLSGPELLCRHLSKGKKGGRIIKFL
ncbi:hypothetical protein U0070_007133 [Myodes glareolus]|uniref:Small ribosomal subunit protein uS2 C-terminal domain-containing protein n=1 Tax=Myodes glareolus TaxID=447135 RepID=A0AAW0JPQ5_MYOGA